MAETGIEQGINKKYFATNKMFNKKHINIVYYLTYFYVLLLCGKFLFLRACENRIQEHVNIL